MKSKALRIGLIGSGDDSSSKLLRLLAEQGMQVVHALLPKDLTEAHIAATDLDVWLLDLDDSHWHDQLDELMDRSSVPIFFNEHQSIEGQQHLDYWCRNLISRMFELVADVPGLPAVSAPAPAASRSSDTLHIAFPASPAVKKAESKPSDELTPAPAALDPVLLQEIEELEQLLQTPDTQHETLPDLDDSLPLPSAQDDFIFTPAPAKTPATPNASGATKPAEPAVTAKPSAPAGEVPGKPLDPVAAAKERAAKIKQQAAANLAKTEAVPTPAAATPPPTEKETPAPAAPPTANKASSVLAPAMPSTLAPTPAPSEPAAKSPAVIPPPVIQKTPAPVSPASPATSAVTTAPAVTKPVAPTPAEKIVAAVPETASKPASEAKPAATATATTPAEQKANANVSLDITALEPVASPPEKHDWPTFPPPATKQGSPTLPTEPASADFAPIQPQPAAGPMREPARPLSVVPATTATVKPAASKATAEPATTTNEVKASPTAASYSEPVPTLTPASIDDLEFEAVDFEPAHDELEPHGDFDVPMLESVASANASEFEAVTDLPPALPCDLWVLGASLGGPAALKRFFTALDQPLPICFLLAQHIDAHFLPVLGKILEQANPFYAVQVLARPGLIEPGSLLLAPIEKRLRFLDAGQIVHSGKSWTPPYSPCIDDVLSDVAAAYPGQVHAIVFSGMGEDGVDGARAIRDGQGQIWVQEAESCASSVMPDAIHLAGLAQQRATPEQLASQLMARYRQSADSKNLA